MARFAFKAYDATACSRRGDCGRLKGRCDRRAARKGQIPSKFGNPPRSLKRGGTAICSGPGSAQRRWRSSHVNWPVW